MENEIMQLLSALGGAGKRNSGLATLMGALSRPAMASSNPPGDLPMTVRPGPGGEFVGGRPGTYSSHYGVEYDDSEGGLGLDSPDEAAALLNRGPFEVRGMDVYDANGRPWEAMDMLRTFERGIKNGTWDTPEEMIAVINKRIGFSGPRHSTPTRKTPAPRNVLAMLDAAPLRRGG